MGFRPRDLVAQASHSGMYLVPLALRHREQNRSGLRANGYLITPTNDKRHSNSADTVPSSWNAEQQQTPEMNAGTSGEAATSPAADRKEARKNRPFFE